MKPPSKTQHEATFSIGKCPLCRQSIEADAVFDIAFKLGPVEHDPVTGIATANLNGDPSFRRLSVSHRCEADDQKEVRKCNTCGGSEDDPPCQKGPGGLSGHTFGGGCEANAEARR